MTRQEFQAASGIIGQSSEIRELVDIALQVAPTDLSVLVTGESGTGKEVFARGIHEASLRGGKRFVAVNCSAIPETLIESELFGHERGSFTGAYESRKGYFEQADGGTIFLDEIGETPLSTQVKLLRVLESGEIAPVGATTSRHVNTRVIAATNRDLEFEVHRGTFRQDLFFRLRAVQIHLPPLRERTEDIPLFVDFFAEQVSAKHHVVFRGIEPDAMRRLQAHPWNGNIRELKHLIETVLVLEKGERITTAMLDKYLVPRATLPVFAPSKPAEQQEREMIIRALIELRNDISALRDAVDDLSRGRMVAPSRSEGAIEVTDLRMEDAEKRLIAEALRRNRYNKRRAAHELGISERTLYRKISTFHLLDGDA